MKSMSNLTLSILLGWAAGYAVNYLADVLPATRRLSRPTCRHCGAPYSLGGYLAGGGCGQCGRRHSWRFLVVLVLMASASGFISIMPPARLGYYLGLILLTYFGTVFVIDAEHRLILHPTSIVGAILGLGLGWLSHGLTATLLGGLAGFLIMLALYVLGAWFSRMRARRMQAAGQAFDGEEALGQGDVMLAIVLGLLLGWPLIWFGLLLGILLAGAYGILLVVWTLAARRNHQEALRVFMPYGPFLLLSASLIIFLPHWLATLLPR